MNNPFTIPTFSDKFDSFDLHEHQRHKQYIQQLCADHERPEWHGRLFTLDSSSQSKVSSKHLFISFVWCFLTNLCIQPAAKRRKKNDKDDKVHRASLLDSDFSNIIREI